MRAMSACAPTTPPCSRPAAARCWSRTRPTRPHGLCGHARAQGAGRDRLLHHRPWRAFRPTPGALSLQPRRDPAGHDKPGAGDVLAAEPEQLDRLQLALTEIGYEMRGIVTASDERHPAGLRRRRRYRPAHRVCRGRSGSAGQISRRRRAVAAAARSGISGRCRICEKHLARRRRAQRPSRPSSSIRSIISAPIPTRWRCRIIRRIRSPSGSRSRYFRRRGRYARRRRRRA